MTLEHKYSSTTIQAEPKKVVSLGLSDQDAVLALGVKPVGAVDWFKEHFTHHRKGSGRPC